MRITEVRIKLADVPSERLKAYCSITLDECFVIRDLKIIDGPNGPFVAMPSRKLTAHCSHCGSKNHLRANYCNQCGGRLHPDRFGRDEEGRAKLYADIAHPINASCRELIQQSVVKAYHEELEQSRLPGYVSRYEDLDHEGLPVRTSADGAEAPRGPHRPPVTSPPAVLAVPHVAVPHVAAPHATENGRTVEPQTPRESRDAQPVGMPRHTEPETFGAGIF